MLMVLETVQDHQIEILLAKETFDSKITPVRAWAAQMELDGMKERMGMGVKARLKAGKANTGQDRYGYLCIEDKIHNVEEGAMRLCSHSKNAVIYKMKLYGNVGSKKHPAKCRAFFVLIDWFLPPTRHLRVYEIYTRIPDLYPTGQILVCL